MSTGSPNAGRRGFWPCCPIPPMWKRKATRFPAMKSVRPFPAVTSGRRGRIIVALFASNINRIQKIVDIAEKQQRKIVFNGRSIELSVRIAKELGYLKIKEDMEIDVGSLDEYQDDEIVMVMTGSQGEPMSALARMSTGSHKQIKIQKGRHGHSFIEIHPRQREGHCQYYQQPVSAGRRCHIRKNFRYPCFRACISGRAEADDQPHQTKVFHPHSW